VEKAAPFVHRGEVRCTNSDGGKVPLTPAQVKAAAKPYLIARVY